MTGSADSTIIAAIAFVGRRTCQVKNLSGFKKGHHTVPDATNATTNAFVAKICEPELTQEAEQLFQSVRTGLAYKRKEISLSVSGSTALLSARDFSLELQYALDESEPSRVVITLTLRDLTAIDVAHTPAFVGIFGGRFTEISFALQKTVSIEAVIDVIEALGEEHGMSVRYPSDCSRCEIMVADVDAHVRCSGGSLEMVFPRGGAPHELTGAFMDVRNAFAVSPVLRGMLGG